MIFISHNFEQAMRSFLTYSQTLMQVAIQRELDKQRNEYEETLTVVMHGSRVDRDTALAMTGEFVSDEKTAARYAKTSIEVGIGNRVRGAIACFEADDQAECARLLVLAQATMFDIIGLPKGSHALSDAADFMFKEAQGRKRKAA